MLPNSLPSGEWWLNSYEGGEIGDLHPSRERADIASTVSYSHVEKLKRTRRIRLVIKNVGE